MARMEFKSLIIISILLFCGCSKDSHKMLYDQNPAFYSYIVSDINTSLIETEFNSEIYITPASCAKVVTALLAYEILGENYKYQTKLYTRKSGGKIKDLLIKFSGDPTFSYQHMIDLLSPLKNTKIDGNIILDASLFKVPHYSQNIMIEDINSEYLQPLGAMNVDGNQIKLKIIPTKFASQALVNQVGSNFKIVDSIITDSNPTLIRSKYENGIVYVHGNVNIDKGEIEKKISIELNAYLLAKINDALRELNITGKSIIAYNDTIYDKNYKLENSVNSNELYEIIDPALKKSDNFVFDALYLKIMSKYDPQFDNWSKGGPIMNNLIKNVLFIDAEDALFIDGSGISRYNRIKPLTLLKILSKGFSNSKFISALPYAGEDMTTLKDYKLMPTTIRAKTGSMLGIRCLCGYNIGYNPKAFVFTASNFSPPLIKTDEAKKNFVNYLMKIIGGSGYFE